MVAEGADTQDLLITKDQFAPFDVWLITIVGELGRRLQ